MRSYECVKMSSESKVDVVTVKVAVFFHKWLLESKRSHIDLQTTVLLPSGVVICKLTKEHIRRWVRKLQTTLQVHYITHVLLTQLYLGSCMHYV